MLIKFKTTKQKIELSDEDFAIGEPIMVKDGNGEEIQVSLIVTYVLQAVNVDKLYN